MKLSQWYTTMQVLCRMQHVKIYHIVWRHVTSKNLVIIRCFHNGIFTADQRAVQHHTIYDIHSCWRLRQNDIFHYFMKQVESAHNMCFKQRDMPKYSCFHIRFLYLSLHICFLKQKICVFRGLDVISNSIAAKFFNYSSAALKSCP